ncbi:hypothetical protein DOTSEDRAFT_36049 [Dothistroma septosporum NZE10]|uniref:Uncharacterized protein n=1 Tax=Dothistroma septosporum (strain NZE10 / CBS 128990) TaxID=675120 RepID=N1PJ28_DOTSN|nr:hypothetical protein DOTSEDRAFT_36049 [Dothistroma septosporum NZE10]
MSLSNTTNATMPIATPTARPSSPSLTAPFRHLIAFFSVILSWLLPIIAWISGVFVTSTLGGGAMLLIRWLLGYEEEQIEDQPPVALVAGFSGTFVFQLLFVGYLYDIEEQFTSLAMLGMSMVAVLVVWSTILTVVGVGLWIVRTLGCKMKGMEREELGRRRLRKENLCLSDRGTQQNAQRESMTADAERWPRYLFQCQCTRSNARYNTVYVIDENILNMCSTRVGV